jgi:hypothetical protein
LLRRRSIEEALKNPLKHREAEETFALFNVRWLCEETEPAAPFISLVVERILRKEEESARRMASFFLFLQDCWPLFPL